MEHCPALSTLSILFASLFLSSCSSNNTPDELDTINIQQVSTVTSNSTPDLETTTYCPQRSETGGQSVVSLERDGPCRPKKLVGRVIQLTPPTPLIWGQGDWDEENWQ